MKNLWARLGWAVSRWLKVSSDIDAARLQLSLSALRDAEERHYRGLVEALQRQLMRLGAIEAKQDRLLMLLEPVATRARTQPVYAPGWDQIQQENLTQFEETSK